MLLYILLSIDLKKIQYFETPLPHPKKWYFDKIAFRNCLDSRFNGLEKRVLDLKVTNSIPYAIGISDYIIENGSCWQSWDENFFN